MAEDFNLQVSVCLPPSGQYAKGDMLNVRAATADELRGQLDELFGEGTGDRIFGRFAASTMVELDFSKSSVVGTPAATSTGGGVGETCPECGAGTLREKQRKDGKGSFVGCNNYPACSYIKR